MPESQLDEETRSAMPLDLHPGFWWRVIEDPQRGWPATHVEFAWVDGQEVLNFAAVAGLTFDPEPDGIDEREVIDGRRVHLRDIATVTINLGPGGGDTVTLTNGETHDDWPALLINLHPRPGRIPLRPPLPGKRAGSHETKLAGQFLGTVQSSWAGTMGGPPASDSPLAKDLARENIYRTERLPAPISQAWAYAQTAGLVALNHIKLLSESLIHYSNGAGSCPVSAVESLTRIALEAYSVQRWIADPTIAIRDRYARWLCLETISVRSSWTMAHEGAIPHSKNPALVSLYNDAEQNEVPYHHAGDWIGCHEPKDTELASQLLSRFAVYVPNHLSSEDAAKWARIMYRQLSGGVHANAGHVMSSLIPTGEVSDEGISINSYGLSTSVLWRCIATALLAKLTSGYEYAAWVGRSVPSEARRITLHHLDEAIRRMNQ